MTKIPFLDFFNFFKYCRYDSSYFPIAFLHQIRVLYVQWHQNWMRFRNKTKSSPKWPGKGQLRTPSVFSKNVNAIERNFLQSFYTVLGSYVCNGIKIVWLWSNKHSKKESKNYQKTTSFDLFTNFSKTVLTDRTKFSAVILHKISVLKVQWHQTRMPVIW